MNKWIRTAALLLLAAFALSGCVLLFDGYDPEKFRTTSYEIAEYVCAEPATSVKIDDSDQDIRIYPSEDGKCRIEYYESEYDNYDIVLKDGVLYVKHTTRFHISFFDTGIYGGITLYLPEDECESLQVDVASGDIIMEYCGAKDVELGTASGDIHVQECTAVNMTLGAASGDIAIVDSAADSIVIDSASGDIFIRDITAAAGLNIDTASGDVDFSGVDAGSIYVTAASGDVYGSVVKPMLYEADSTSGDVNIPVPMRDAGICRNETASGDITIIEE